MALLHTCAVGSRVSIAAHDFRSRGQDRRQALRRHRRAHSPERHRSFQAVRRRPSCCAAPSTRSTSPNRRGRAWPWTRARSASSCSTAASKPIVQVTSRDRNRIADAVGPARRRGAGTEEFCVHGRRFHGRRRSSRGEARVRPHGVGIAGRGGGAAQRPRPCGQCPARARPTCSSAQRRIRARRIRGRNREHATQDRRGSPLAADAGVYHADPCSASSTP